MNLAASSPPAFQARSWAYWQGEVPTWDSYTSTGVSTSSPHSRSLPSTLLSSGLGMRQSAGGEQVRLRTMYPSCEKPCSCKRPETKYELM